MVSPQLIFSAQALDSPLKCPILIILYQTGQKASSNNLLLFDFDVELDGINDGMNTRDNLEKIDKKDAELPLFSYESVSSATNNFSAANKLGEGGFGPVYKVRIYDSFS
jgi:hypothetical protein